MFDEEPEDDLHGQCAHEIHRLEAEVERLKVSHERYEKLRKLNVQQFQGLYLANINGAGRFDDLVDALEVKS